MNRLRFAKDGEAELVGLDGERVTLLAAEAAPPGAYVDCELAPTDEHPHGAAFRIKVRACKREGERFRVDGRVLDLSKALRELLAAVAGET